MQKGFTLAETLITMAVIGVIMALSIPAVIQSTNDTTPLLKKAYNSVEEVVNELINDTSLYPSGELTTGTNTFCNNFFSKLNTIGAVSCAEAAVAVPPANPDVTTTNAMRWYNLHAATGTSATNGFTADNCDGPNGTTNPNLTTIDDTTNTCIRLSVDVNGANKGANTSAAQANRDIFIIYITNAGKVTVKTSATNTYDEAYILQH